MPESFRLTTPEQLRAISDPFRQRLIGVFQAPRTARLAAEQLGVPVGRLYHHLDQLEAAGILKVVAERRRRGAIERTFQTVARRFEVAPEVLGSGPARTATRGALARAALDEVLAGVATDGPDHLHLARTRVRLTPEALAWFESRLGEFLKELESPEGAETDILFFAAPRSG